MFVFNTELSHFSYKCKQMANSHTSYQNINDNPTCEMIEGTLDQ